MRRSRTVSPSQGPDAMPVGAWIRIAAATIALLAWTGLLANCVGVYGRRGALGETLWIIAGYFSNMTALLVAILFTGIALGAAGFMQSSLLAAAALTSLLVGIVERVLLHGLRVLHGADALADVLLHAVMPILVPLFWLAFAAKGTLRRRDPALWLLYPLAYLAWALGRGLSGGRYAYPFIDPVRQGWPGVFAYAAAIAAGFLMLGGALVALDGRLGRIRGTKALTGR